MKNISHVQVLIILWLLSPILLGTIESVVLHPNNIWPNNDGTGLSLSSSVLFIPYFVVFYILYFPLSWLPIDGGGTGAFLQILPNLNTFGSILIGSLLVIVWTVIGYWLGKRLSQYTWKKYSTLLFGTLLLFDVSLFAYQVHVDVDSKRPERVQRGAIFEQCNGNGPEYEGCFTQCENQLDALRSQDNQSHNQFWVECTSTCNNLRMTFQETCLRESRLPEYQNRQ